MHVLVDVWMQTSGHRAEVDYTADSLFYSVGSVRGKRYGQVDFDARNTAGIVGHVLEGLSLGVEQHKPLVLSINAHGCHDAGRQTKGAQICRRKCRAHALVVGGGVGEDLGTGLRVEVFAPQVAEVGSVECSHGPKLRIERGAAVRLEPEESARELQ